MSVEGLSAMAFEDTVEKRVRRVDDAQDMFEESRIGESSRKVGLKAYPGGGYVLFVEQPRLWEQIIIVGTCTISHTSLLPI